IDIPDDPMEPAFGVTRRVIGEKGDDTPIRWISREERFQEKLATPDVSVADLIGDIDPVKVMSRRLELSDESAIHYGIIPRSNRGIFAFNELPDLQPRIQVSLLNILEENDIQIRGFPVRIPLDLMIVFTANPEDYTNRGSIITPLKDRIDAQILTH
ncbi:MAG: AAA family ATPase, partial [Candidatus Omnitrophica bacterium]|nr:AAA family ATPase [Candidatus Omnitrophota bacterium]